MYVKDMPSVAAAACHNEGSDASRDGQMDDDLVLDGVIDDRITAAYAIVELGERESKKVAEFPSNELDEDIEVDDLDQYHQVPRSPEYCRKDRRRKYYQRGSADSSPTRTPQSSLVESYTPRFGHVRGAVMPSRSSGKPVPKLPPKRRLEDEGITGGIKAKLARMLFEKKISRTDSSEKLPEGDEKETGVKCKGTVDSDEEQQVESQGGRFVRTSMPLLQPINVISCAQSAARYELPDNQENLQIRLEQSLSAEEISRLRESLLRNRVREADAKIKKLPLNVSTASSRVSPNHARRSPPTAVEWPKVEMPADLIIPASSSRFPAFPNTPKVQLARSSKDTEVQNLSQFLPQNEATDFSIREDASRVNIPPSWPIMSGLPPFLLLGSASESALNSDAQHSSMSEGCEPMVVKTLVPGTGLVQYLVLPRTKSTLNLENPVSSACHDLKVSETVEKRQHLDDAMTKLEKFSLGKHSHSGSPQRSELISSNAGIPYWCLAPQARSFYPQFGSLNSISNYYSVTTSPPLSEFGLYPPNSAVSRSCHDLTRIPSESPNFQGVPGGLPRRPSPNRKVGYERPKSNESVHGSRSRRMQRIHTSRRKISPVACALEMVRGGEFGSLRTLQKFYNSLKSRSTLNFSGKPVKKRELDELRERMSQNYEKDTQDFPLDLSSDRKKFSIEQKLEVKHCPSEPQSFSDCKTGVPFKTNPIVPSLGQHDSSSKPGSREMCSDGLYSQHQKSCISDFSDLRNVEVTVGKSANPSLAPHSLSTVLPNSSLPPKKRKLRQPSQSCDMSESKTATSISCIGSTFANHLQADKIQTKGDSERLGATQSEELDVNKKSTADVSPAEIGFTLTPEMKLLENKVGVRDEDGDLPLHIAVAKGYLEFVQKVLLPMMSHHGVHIDSCNHQRQTALHLAVITNQPQMVETLLKASASASVCDRKGNTAIHLAVKYKTPSCLQHILTNSSIQIDLDAKNYEGLTALHLGVQLGEREAVRALLANGADPNAMDGTNGRTPLFYAVETNDDDMASILLKHGSDPCIASYSGCTPLQIATAKSFRDMTNMLERSFQRGFEITARQEENFGHV